MTYRPGGRHADTAVSTDMLTSASGVPCPLYGIPIGVKKVSSEPNWPLFAPWGMFFRRASRIRWPGWAAAQLIISWQSLCESQWPTGHFFFPLSNPLGSAST